MLRSQFFGVVHLCCAARGLVIVVATSRDVVQPDRPDAHSNLSMTDKYDSSIPLCAPLLPDVRSFLLLEVWAVAALYRLGCRSHVSVFT